MKQKVKAFVKVRSLRTRICPLFGLRPTFKYFEKTKELPTTLSTPNLTTLLSSKSSNTKKLANSTNTKIEMAEAIIHRTESTIRAV